MNTALFQMHSIQPPHIMHDRPCLQWAQCENVSRVKTSRALGSGTYKQLVCSTMQRLKQEKDVLSYLLIPLCDVHGALVVVVLVGALGGVDRQQLVVGSQPVPLGITVCEHTRLQQLVI